MKAGEGLLDIHLLFWCLISLVIAACVTSMTSIDIPSDPLSASALLFYMCLRACKPLGVHVLHVRAGTEYASCITGVISLTVCLFLCVCERVYVCSHSPSLMV